MRSANLKLRGYTVDTNKVAVTVFMLKRHEFLLLCNASVKMTNLQVLSRDFDIVPFAVLELYKPMA